jgi:hypothetical protein
VRARRQEEKKAYVMIASQFTMENLLTNDEIDWLCKFLEGKGSNNEIIEKIVVITRKLEKMKRR